MEKSWYPKTGMVDQVILNFIGSPVASSGPMSLAPARRVIWPDTMAKKLFTLLLQPAVF